VIRTNDRFDLITPWFDYPDQPARPGVYMRHAGGADTFSLWTGDAWLYSTRSIVEAATQTIESLNQTPRWRGLAYDPRGVRP